MSDPTLSTTSKESASNSDGSSKDRAVLIKRFKRDGYVILDRVLQGDFLASIQTALDREMSKKVAASGLSQVPYEDNRGVGNDNVTIDFRPAGANHDLNRWNMM